MRLLVTFVSLLFLLTITGNLHAQNDESGLSIRDLKLSDYQAFGSWKQLKATDESFGRPVSAGGPFQCLVDSRTKPFHWRVVFFPRKEHFYLVDSASPAGLFFGPIPGDPIAKLGLLESRLVIDGDAKQNRQHGLVRSRVKKLLSATDKLLLRYGLRAVPELGELAQHEVRQWSDLVMVASNQRAARVHLQHECKIAKDFIAKQRVKIESMKMEIGLAEYRRSRTPTDAEKKLVWGEPIDGLSLAVVPWKKRSKQISIGEQIDIQYLVRNTSNQPKKVATLNVLDGVSARVVNQETGHHALLTFGAILGRPLTERFLIARGELVVLKRFGFRLREGDLHPPNKKFNPKNTKHMYGHVLVRPGERYGINFKFSLPSAFSEHKGKITLPAKGEFEGTLSTELEFFVPGQEEKTCLLYTSPSPRD